MVTGTAVDKKGDPIPGARIRLIESNGSSGRPSYFGLDTLTDTEGRFAFCGMKPDEYTLQVRIRGPKVVESSKSFKLGQRRSLDKKLKVTGR
ncbi:MAG: protocatechuate 3,4-dioxygenase beta subunit [Planctomycetota bacterium]|jgi:protocatechuate 3,4-dioxygenase beta subunit